MHHHHAIRVALPFAAALPLLWLAALTTEPRSAALAPTVSTLAIAPDAPAASDDRQAGVVRIFESTLDFVREISRSFERRDYAGAVYLAGHRVIQHDDVRQVWLTTIEQPTTGLLCRPGALGTAGPSPGPMARPRRWPRKGGIGADFIGLSGTRRVVGRVPGRVPGEGGATPLFPGSA